MEIQRQGYKFGIFMKIFLKNRGFISSVYRLPEIINYQTDYPYINKIESQIKTTYSVKESKEPCHITLWRDVYKKEEILFNIESTVKLNKYLFNNDKTQLDWLFENEQLFLIHLVTTSGYMQDKKLLDLVLKHYMKHDKSSLNELLWRYNIKNKLVINSEIFELISTKIGDKKVDKASENRYLKEIQKYLNDIDNFDGTEEEKQRVKKYLTDFIIQHTLH